MAQIDGADKAGLDGSKVTIVLPCTRRDFERLLVLMASLHRFLDPSVSALAAAWPSATLCTLCAERHIYMSAVCLSDATTSCIQHVHGQCTAGRCKYVRFVCRLPPPNPPTSACQHTAAAAVCGPHVHNVHMRTARQQPIHQLTNPAK